MTGVGVNFCRPDRDTVSLGFAEVGVDEVIARVLPDEKAERIAQLQAAGHHVAMVGDGVNDSAALATATLGVAVMQGTDIAMKAADIIIVREDLRAVVDSSGRSGITSPPSRSQQQDSSIRSLPPPRWRCHQRSSFRTVFGCGRTDAARTT